MNTNIPSGSGEEKNTRLIIKKSAVPIWVSAGVWIFAALFLPMYRIYHYITVFLISMIARGVLDKIIPPKKEYAEIPEIPPDTGNPSLDSMITEIRSSLSQIEEAKKSIEKKHPGTASDMSEISRTIMKISAFVEEKPENLPLIRRFMNYYLPTTLKLVRKYSYLDSQDETGLSNIDSTMKHIEDILKTVSLAMKKQLDALFADDALDISADIEVLESMLEKDGFK